MSANRDVVTRIVDHRRRSPRFCCKSCARFKRSSTGFRVIPPAVAECLSIPTTQVDSVVQFYAFLHDQPRGRYRILFSDNITDRMLGSLTLFEHMLKRLRLQRGEVSTDGAVSVDLTSCTGMCDEGPALLVNNRPITRLTVRPRRRDLRSGPQRRSTCRVASRLFPRRGQHPPRRRPARFATRAGIGFAGGDHAPPPGHARRDEAIQPARTRRSRVRDSRQMGGLPQRPRR